MLKTIDVVIAIVIWLSALAFVIGMVMLAIIVVAARRDVRHAPRKDMYLCEKHGPMPVGATITLMDGDVDQVIDGRTVRGPLRSCPMCFNEAIQKAKQ